MPLRDVIAIILGGGRGSRLYPLTKLRTKPAVPLAGNYRLIDIPISNCINSGVERIFVLTQFLSASLVRHVQRTYKFDMFSDGFVDMLPAEQTLTSSDWYQGTADAVLRQLHHFTARGARDCLILAGDHLYRMDYGRFLAVHRSTDADATVAVLPVGEADVGRFGILKTEADGRIVAFHEKPQGNQELLDLQSRPGDERPYLGSMGIYLFKTEVLERMLKANIGDDFGRHIIPAAVNAGRVWSFPFEGYWEDIGTLEAFYHANLALTRESRPFNFYDPKLPIYTRPRFLPASRIDGCHMHRVVVASGCRLYNATIDECVLGLRSVVRPRARLSKVVMLGADFYENGDDKARNQAKGIPDLGIGEGAVIERAIIDKDARIGAGVVIRNCKGQPDREEDNYVVRDGFVVVPKGAVIPAGTIV